MELLLQNNVDINEMKQLMQMLEREYKMPESLAFLSTHPLTKQRIAGANFFIKQHDQPINERNDLRLIFDQLTTVIKQH